MERQKVGSLTDRDGVRGTFRAADPQADAPEQVQVELEDGRQFLLPFELLERRLDDSYYLPLSLEDLSPQPDGNSQEVIVLPVVEETVRVEKRLVETGRVRVRKVLQEREEVVDEPLLRERVDIRRVPMNQVVTGPVAVRQEGETLIISVVEEVLVVEKRLVLTEEIHITKQQVETREPQTVTLRLEEVAIERIEGERESDPGIEPA